MFGSNQSETVVLLLQQMLAQQKELAQQMLAQQKEMAEQQAVHHEQLLAALRSPEQPKASALPGSAEAPMGPVSGDEEDLTPGLDSTMRFRKVQGLHWPKITVMNYNILAHVLIKTRS